MPESELRDFWVEQRRLDALERQEIKRQASIPVVAIPVVEKPQQQAQQKKRKKKRPKRSYPVSTRVPLLCEICESPYSVRPAYVGRVHTCGKADCTRKKRSLSQQARNKDRANPKKCLHPECQNLLNPDKKSHHQEKYCSVKCAARHRVLLNLQLP